MMKIGVLLFLFLCMVMTTGTYAFGAQNSCSQANLKEPVGFYLAKDTTAPDPHPQIFKVDGKDFPLKKNTEAFKLISKQAVLSKADIEEIKLVDVQNIKQADGRPTPGLQFKLTIAGRSKLAKVTKENKGKLLVIKAGGHVVATPEIMGEINQDPQLTLPGDQDASALFLSICKKQSGV
jgi:preprotein translocase subunit SecD